MADVNETLVKEAIRRAEEAARTAKDETGKDGLPDAEDKDETGAGKINENDAPENDADSAAEEDDSGEEQDTEASEAGDDNDDGENGDAEDGGGEDADDAREHKKNRLFGRKNRKDSRDEKIEELNDKLLRNLAEFENFRKRTEKEKSQMFEIGAKSIIEKILPAIDSFERGLGTISDADKTSPLAEGMEKIYKQLITSLEDAGLKTIDAVGKEFDPNLHNAVMHEENEELGENIVSEELQKGYTYHDSVVRHSMVKVAN